MPGAVCVRRDSNGRRSCERNAVPGLAQVAARLADRSMSDVPDIPPDIAWADLVQFVAPVPDWVCRDVDRTAAVTPREEGASVQASGQQKPERAGTITFGS